MDSSPGLLLANKYSPPLSPHHSYFPYLSKNSHKQILERNQTMSRLNQPSEGKAAVPCSGCFVLLLLARKSCRGEKETKCFPWASKLPQLHPGQASAVHTLDKIRKEVVHSEPGLPPTPPHPRTAPRLLPGIQSLFAHSPFTLIAHTNTHTRAHTHYPPK